MRRMRITALGVLALGLGLAPAAMAADHLDGPGVQAAPAADITDVYAWMSPDGAQVNLVMDVFPSATTTSTFDPAVKYVFHVSGQSAWAPTGPKPTSLYNIICQFDQNKQISCWVVDVKNGGAVLDYVNGDASATAGLQSTSQKVKVFAGLRDDPFFFNLAGFKAALMAGAAFTTNEDTHKCPLNVPASTVQTVLASNGMGGKGTDSFAPAQGGYSGNVLSIVMTVDKTLFAGAVLGVWASTNK